jgi:hypothetical protein
MELAGARGNRWQKKQTAPSSCSEARSSFWQGCYPVAHVASHPIAAEAADRVLVRVGRKGHDHSEPEERARDRKTKGWTERNEHPEHHQRRGEVDDVSPEGVPLRTRPSKATRWARSSEAHRAMEHRPKTPGATCRGSLLVPRGTHARLAAEPTQPVGRAAQPGQRVPRHRSRRAAPRSSGRNRVA